LRIPSAETHGWRTVAVSVMVAMSTSGCSLGPERAVVESMAGRSEAALRDQVVESLEELVAPPSFGVVGTVVEVRPGTGMWWDAADGGTRHLVEVDHHMAEIVTVHLTMRVESRAFGPAPDVDGLVTFGAVLDADAELPAARSLFEGERLFVVMGPDDGTWDYAEGVHAVQLAGAFMARTLSGGELDYLVAPPETVRSLGLDELTVSQIASLAAS
jgi:hypothetical protein